MSVVGCSIILLFGILRIQTESRNQTRNLASRTALGVRLPDESYLLISLMVRFAEEDEPRSRNPTGAFESPFLHQTESLGLL